jgi:hypothetical protein
MISMYSCTTAVHVLNLVLLFSIVYRAFRFRMMSRNRTKFSINIILSAEWNMSSYSCRIRLKTFENLQLIADLAQFGAKFGK